VNPIIFSPYAFQSDLAVHDSGDNISIAEAMAPLDHDTIAVQDAGWDLDMLKVELEELEKANFSLDLTGFSLEEVGALFNDRHLDIEDDDVPEPPAEPRTKPGDIWVLGEHRLMCGDSTKPEDVAMLMDGARADLWLTDPPYNVNYKGGTEKALKIQNDHMKDGEFRTFLQQAFGAAFDVLKPGASFYIWHADSEGYNFRGAVRDSGQTVRQCLIWVKDVLVLGHSDYQWQHEPCLYGWKEGAAHGWYSDRAQSTTLRFNRPKRNEEHPTMKPVALFAYLIGNSTAPQGLVLDTFLGSGTSLIAAEQLGRKCYGMEIDPAYCDVVVERWEKLTGNVAELIPE
jgi:site-specific DNA-methyltransferase (adenine-specific)